VTGIQFEWDERKNRANLRKHGVAFEDAVQVFFDTLRLSFPDRIVDDEQRWHTIGRFEGILLLLVVHTTWEEEDEEQPTEVIRIISARKVTPSERQAYEEYR
jgi:uncharacterized DUF497 family protein